MFYASYAFGIILVICELGQRLTDAFGQIADEVKHFDWYLFPYEIQRILSFILINAQQPVELECFGSVTGIRETFKKVSYSNLCSNFTVRKTLIQKTNHE